jgi:hypothetical protein
MNLSQKIVDAVESVPNETPCPFLVETETDGNRLALILTDRGPVGLAFDGLDFVAARASSFSSDTLRAWGNTLAARLTYLMEPLVVLEVDAEVGEAKLRSVNPTSRDDQRSYYEVCLRRDGSLKLSRWTFDRETRKRERVASQMTFEVLERLVDDIVASFP